MCKKFISKYEMHTKFWVGKPQRKMLLGRARHIQEVDIQTYIKEIGSKEVDLNEVTQNGLQWWAFMITVMMSGFYDRMLNQLKKCSRKALYHEIGN
jgi:hypothetical protein